MPKYLFAYHGGGGMATSQDEIAKVMAQWEAWFSQLGAALVDGGNPIGAAKTINASGAVSDGGGANPVSGYSLLDATDLDAALTLAKGCPLLGSGGSVEVCETLAM